MPTFGITAAQIVGLFMETVFYGIYLVTFFSCMHVLLWTSGRFKRWREINKMMTTAALLMFFFGTMDVALGLRHNLEAFVYNQGGPEEEFARVSEWVNVMKIADYDAQTFIGDGVLLYRCFVIYNRRWWVIIAPGLMWIGTAVCSILAVYIEATLADGVLNQKQLTPFITGTLSLTLAMNILTTSLIVYRIWSIQTSTAAMQLSRSSAFRPYTRVLRTLIECGAIYTLSVIILFACYLPSNNAQLGVSDSIVQIIGITFNLIIIRVGKGTAVKPEDRSGSSGPYLDTFITSGASRDSRAFPLHQVKIKTVTTVSREGGDGVLESRSDGKDEARLDSHSENDERLPKPLDNWEASVVAV